MKKLVLFGDSLFGRCGKHLIVELEAKLTSEYDVYNCAAGGWDSIDLARKADFIARLKPDIVAISVGTNDASPWKVVPLDVFKEKVEQIIQSFSDSKIVFFLVPPVNEANRPFEKMIHNETIKKYHDMAKDLCVQNNIAYVDSWSVFMKLQDENTGYHIEDGVHLSDLGYEVLFSEMKRLVV